jgi:hypothetical protein
MDLLVEMNEMPFKELQVTFFFLKEQEGQGAPTGKFIKQRTELRDYSKGKTVKTGDQGESSRT